jgi:large subunit ribosomal protein L9
MPIEVILLKDVESLGKEGDVVRVKDGYARNALYPKHLAAPVTEVTRRRLDKIRRERSAQETAELDAARALAERIGRVSCTVPMKTGEDGKLFGAVTVTHLVEALAKEGLPLDRHQIGLEEPLRDLGVFSVPVRVHPKVTGTLKVWVTGE